MCLKTPFIPSDHIDMNLVSSSDAQEVKAKLQSLIDHIGDADKLYSTNRKLIQRSLLTLAFQFNALSNSQIRAIKRGEAAV